MSCTVESCHLMTQGSGNQSRIKEGSEAPTENVCCLIIFSQGDLEKNKKKFISLGETRAAFGDCWINFDILRRSWSYTGVAMTQKETCHPPLINPGY